MTVTAVPTGAEPRFGQEPLASPSVTLWVPTTPARHLTAADRRSLAHLAHIAVERLQVELGFTALTAIRANLTTALGSAGAAGTDQGLVVHVNSRRCESILLPYPPRPQAIVEPTSAPEGLTGMMNFFAEPGESGPFPGQRQTSATGPVPAEASMVEPGRRTPRPVEDKASRP